VRSCPAPRRAQRSGQAPEPVAGPSRRSRYAGQTRKCPRPSSTLTVLRENRHGRDVPPRLLLGGERAVRVRQFGPRSRAREPKVAASHERPVSDRPPYASRNVRAVDWRGVVRGLDEGPLRPGSGRRITAGFRTLVAAMGRARAAARPADVRHRIPTPVGPCCATRAGNSDAVGSPVCFCSSVPGEAARVVGAVRLARPSVALPCRSRRPTSLLAGVVVAPCRRPGRALPLPGARERL
jgi:hypothetical protein